MTIFGSVPRYINNNRLIEMLKKIFITEGKIYVPRNS